MRQLTNTEALLESGLRITPGPWHHGALRTQGRDPSKDGFDVGANNGSNIAIVLHQAGDRDASETTANANAIAKVPDLLEVAIWAEAAIAYLFGAASRDDDRREEFRRRLTHIQHLLREIQG